MSTVTLCPAEGAAVAAPARAESRRRCGSHGGRGGTARLNRADAHAWLAMLAPLALAAACTLALASRRPHVPTG